MFIILGVCLSCLPLATFGLRVSWYVNLQDRELLLGRSVPRSDVFYWLFVGALVSSPPLLHAWSPLFRRYLPALLANPFLVCSLLIPDLLPFFMGVRRSSLRPLFFSLFCTPVGRLFGCPLLLRSVTPWPAFLPPSLFFALCVVRRSPRRLFCRPTSASGDFVSAGLRPPFLGLLFSDGSLPWPPCVYVAFLPALYAAFLAARRTSSLAALCAASLAARCTACLVTRRASSLAAQCAAFFAARCVACFAARCVACFAAPCAASLAGSSAAFLDAPYVGSLPARPVASLAALAGPPSASVFSRLPLPFRGAFFCSFLGLVSPAGHLLTPVFLFSINFSRSRLCVAPSSWALHTSGLTGMGTRAPRVLPPPSGTFRLLETRQYVTTDWRKCRLYICLLKHEIALYTEGTESVCGVVSSTFPRYTLPRSRLFVNLQSDYSAPIHNTI